MRILIGDKELARQIDLQDTMLAIQDFQIEKVRQTRQMIIRAMYSMDAGNHIEARELARSILEALESILGTTEADTDE